MNRSLRRAWPLLAAATLLLLLPGLASGQILLGTQIDGDVVQLDATTGALISSTPSGQSKLHSSARTPNGDIWVTTGNTGTALARLDSSTFQVAFLRGLHIECRCLAAHPITGDIYLYSTFQELYRYVPATDTLTDLGDVTQPLGGVQALAFDREARLYCYSVSLDPNRNGLWELNPFTSPAVRHLPDPTGTFHQFQFLSSLSNGLLLAGRTELYTIDPVTGVHTLVTPLAEECYGGDLIVDSALSSPFCAPSVMNSIGRSATTVVYGDGMAGTNEVMLGCDGLPFFSSGYFLVSQTTGFVPQAGGSTGNLCLGGAIGRLNAQVKYSGSVSWVATPFDTSSVPTPTGTTSVLPGSTWHFTYWYRDTFPTTTSNFSDGASVTFQ
jgi:hypothetical protein